MPYVNAWYRHYKDSGLVMLGVHSPEFAFEKDIDNVRAAVKKFDIQYPVALDNEHDDLEGLQQQLLAGALFRRRARGRSAAITSAKASTHARNATIRQLLTEAGAKNLPDPLDDAAGRVWRRRRIRANVASPETYVGYARAENFVSPGSFARDATKNYAVPNALTLNQWALGGRWKVAARACALDGAPGRIVFRFKARDLHLVLGPAAAGKPVRFRVTARWRSRRARMHGMDVDANGNGVVREHRLYQLIRAEGCRSRNTSSSSNSSIRVSTPIHSPSVEERRMNEH